jgi:hypothetical protein
MALHRLLNHGDSAGAVPGSEIGYALSMRLSVHPLLHRLRIAGLLLLIGALLPAVPAKALTAVPRSFDELVQLADTVIVGTVTAVRSEMTDTPTQGIISLVTLSQLQVVKGAALEGDYTLQVPGGVVGRYAEDYPGLPMFRVGQRYVLFVRGNRRDFFPVVGVNQGVFRVLTDAAGRQVVVRDDAAAENPALSALTAVAPGLDQFIRDIQARLPAAGSAQ